VERRRAHGVLDGLQPIGQVLAERLLGRLDVLAPIELRQQIDTSPLGLALGAKARVPLLATPSGRRVGVELDLDVVRTALLDNGSAHRHASFARAALARALRVGIGLMFSSGSLWSPGWCA